MWEFIQKNSFLVGALTGSVAAYLLGLIVSYMRREKRWLGFSITSRNVVQSGPTKLALTYDGKPIKRLDSHTVVFRNIGNRSLGGLPVRIQCTGGGAILEHELAMPDGAAFKSEAKSDHIIVNVDLLVPGEAFSLGLTVANSSAEGGIKPIARAEFLELRELGERANTLELLEVLLPHIVLGRAILDIYKFSRRRSGRQLSKPLPSDTTKDYS